MHELTGSVSSFRAAAQERHTHTNKKQSNMSNPWECNNSYSYIGYISDITTTVWYSETGHHSDEKYSWLGQMSLWRWIIWLSRMLNVYQFCPTGGSKGPHFHSNLANSTRIANTIYSYDEIWFLSFCAGLLLMSNKCQLPGLKEISTKCQMNECKQ